MHNLKVENCVLFGRLTEDLNLGCSLSENSEGLFQRAKGRVKIYRRKKHVVELQKFIANHKDRHLKLTTSALFCVWADARVWAHGNHSFDVYLNYLGPVSCFTPS